MWYSSIGSCCVGWVLSWCSYVGALCHACDSFIFFLEGVLCCGCILAWVLSSSNMFVVSVLGVLV